MKMHGKWIVLILTALATSQTTGAADVTAEPYVWKNVKVVAGGFIPGIVFSRVEKGLAYWRTDIGGWCRWEEAGEKRMPLTELLGEANYVGGAGISPDAIDCGEVGIAGGQGSEALAA